MNMTLFDIEMELKGFLENLDSLTTTSDEEDARRDALAKVLAEKTDQVAFYRESIVNYHNLLKSKISELEERKVQIEAKIERFDQYVLTCMTIQSKDSFDGNICKIKKRKPALVVEITDETKIPVEFIKIPEPKPMIMKAEISKLLKRGEIIEGARLVEGKTSLSYSIK